MASPLLESFGTSPTGERIDRNHPLVQDYLKRFSGANLDTAIGSVLQNLNATAAGKTPMATPLSAGTPGFGGGLAEGQAPPEGGIAALTAMPAVPYSPTNGTNGTNGLNGANGTTLGPGGAGSQTAFATAFNTLMDRGKQQTELQNQRNLLLKSLYDQPLIPAELATLSPSQRNAIDNKSMVEWQVMSLNDVIKGRQSQTNDALQYMLAGYKDDQAAAKEAVKAAEEKQQNALKLVTDFATKYPGVLSEDEIRSIYTTGTVTPEMAIKISKASTGAGTEYQSAAGKEYADYVANEKSRGNLKPLSFDQYQNQDANRKARAAGGGSSGSSAAEQKTQAISMVAAAFNGTDQNGNPIKGGDGFVSPKSYKQAKSQWVAAGFSGSDFDSIFSGYVNPNQPKEDPYGFKTSEPNA